MKITKIIIVIAALSALGYTGVKMYRSYLPETSKTVFQTETIARNNIIRSISATGTVEPEELINVGAQVNGLIMSFGKDVAGHTIDFGSKVTKGMILAQIDDVTYKAELQSVQAQVEQAQANILSAKAEIKVKEVDEFLAKHNFDRAKKLLKQKSMTQSDYDSYEATYYSSKAQISKVQADLAQAKAALTIAQAALVKAKRNLEYCEIVSPVDGIIIDRRVSIGQTVVSNQTASSIFLVASDFKKMQVWVSVNEADIGVIKPGMPVIFGCDAFPGVQFRGKVFRLRLNATLSSNVVTYIVEVNVDNKDGKLVPYLTANVKFIRAERRNVLSVPNSALRYTPPAELIRGQAPNPEDGEAVLWVEKTGRLLPVTVKTGLNNGLLAEIITDKLSEGDKIVTGTRQVTVSSGSDNVQNPFLPKMPKRPSRGSAGQRERALKRNGGK